MSLHLHHGEIPQTFRLGAHELASANDRIWFEGNPDRNYRVRRAFMGECQLHPDMLAFIAIRQMAPGARIRAGFFRPGPTPETEAPEDIAAFIFGELTVADTRVAEMVEAMGHAIAKARA